MSTLDFARRNARARCGVKGPRAAEWLTLQGVIVPAAPNTWSRAASDGVAPDEGLLIARLGAGEFFLDDVAGSQILERVASGALAQNGVYPVLREDAAFVIGGEAVHDVLAQVCNVNFAALALDSNPVIMTLMMGVAVLVVPEVTVVGRRYGIWCDPTFGGYLEHELAAIVGECGGLRRRA